MRRFFALLFVLSTMVGTLANHYDYQIISSVCLLVMLLSLIGYAVSPKKINSIENGQQQSKEKV